MTTEYGRRTSLRRIGLTRRGLIRAAGASAALPLLGIRPPGAAAQGDVVELTYWHGWTEQWSQMVEYVVDQFHQKQSRIVVKPVVVPVASQEQASEFLAKLTAAIAAGNPPDIVTLFGSTAIPTLADEDAILSLDSIQGADLPSVQAWMDPNIYKLGQYQDKLYGLSYWAGCYCVLYNKDHFTAAGLDPENGPATIADLDAYAEKLTQRRDNGDIERMGFLPSKENFELWGTVFGGSFYDAENRKVTANDPNLVKALEWYVSYAKKYGPDKVAAFEEGLASERAASLDPFISGKFAMQDQGPWKLGDIKKFGDPSFKYGVVRPPLSAPDAPPSNWTWGDIQIIPKGTAHPAEALEFVKFTAGVGDPQGYAQRVVWGNRPINVPVSRQVLDVPSFQQVVKDYPGFETFIDALLNGKRIGSPPVMPAAAFYADRLVSTVEKVMLLQEEPQAALDALTEEVQAELDSR